MGLLRKAKPLSMTRTTEGRTGSCPATAAWASAPRRCRGAAALPASGAGLPPAAAPATR